MAGVKALSLASAAVLALTRAALAADLLPPPPVLEPLPPAPTEFGGWYLRGDVGAAFNASSIDLQNTPNPLATGYYDGSANQSFNNTSLSSSALFDVGVGYRFFPWLRGDVTMEYRDGAHFQSAYNLNDVDYVAEGHPFAQYTDFYRANASSLIEMVNIYGDLGTWYGVTPFIGGGVGVAENSLYGMTDAGINNTGVGAGVPTGGFFKNGWKTDFAWALMAGLDFNVTQNLKLELGYRYMSYGKITSGGSNCITGTGAGFSPAYCGGGSNYVSSTSRLASNDLRLGLIWTFGEAPQPAPVEPLVRKY